MMTIPQPSHHSSPELRVPEKLSTKGNELEALELVLLKKFS